MSSVGTYLRELRQRKGVSLEEIARTTRVAQRFLESIEADAFDTLPSPVFTRGFIRAYCQALSEPPEEALAAFEGREITAPPPAVVAARPGAPAASRPAASAPRPGAAAARAAAEGEPRGRGAVLVSFVLLVILGIALFAVALVIHPRDRSERVAVSEPRPETRPVRPPSEPTPSAPVASQPPAPSAPTASPGAPGQPTACAPRPAAPGAAAPPTAMAPGAPGAAPSAPATPGAPPPTAPRPAPAPSTPPAPGTSQAPTAGAPPAAQAVPVPPSLEAAVGSVSSPYRLVARTNETTWIRVRTEDGRTSEENVPPGEVREWISNRPFTVTVGNAGGVSFELNGRALPPLGPKGAVIQRIVLPPEAR